MVKRGENFEEKGRNGKQIKKINNFCFFSEQFGKSVNIGGK
jgi:hypothetical protein